MIISDTREEAKQFNLSCFAENAQGKYISPFHDIPMFADESQVKYNSRHLINNVCNMLQTNLALSMNKTWLYRRKVIVCLGRRFLYLVVAVDYLLPYLFLVM